MNPIKLPLPFFLLTVLLLELNVSAQTWTNWTQGSTSTTGATTAYQSSGTYTWDFVGDFTGYVTTNQVRVVAGASGELVVSLADQGYANISRSPSGTAYSLWSWTGTPGQGTAVGVHFETYHYGIVNASAKAWVRFSGSEALVWSTASSQSSLLVYHGNSTWASDTGSAYGDAYTYTYGDGTGGNPEVYPDLGTSANTTLDDEDINEYTDHGDTMQGCDVYATYIVDIDSNYTTSSSLSLLTANVSINMYLSGEVDLDSPNSTEPWGAAYLFVAASGENKISLDFTP